MVVALLALALAVRLGVVFATPDFTPQSDPADYERHALAIESGHWPPPDRATEGATAYRPPLYPLFLGAVHRITPGGRDWPRAAQAVVGAITVALVGLVALQLFGARVATVALGIAAVHPSMWAIGATYMSEVLFVPLVLGSVAAALRYARDGRRLRWLVAAGVLAGLATLTRTNGALLLVPLLVAAWPPRGERRGPRALVPIAALLAATAVAIAPWAIRNAVEFDRFVPVSTQDGATLAGTYNDDTREGRRFPASRFPAAWVEWYAVPENVAALRDVPANEVDQGEALRERALDHAADHPGYVAEVAWWNLRRDLDAAGRDWVEFDLAVTALPTSLAVPELAGFWLVTLFALLGASTAAARAAPRWVWLVPAVMLATVLAVGYIRMRAPVDPFLAILAALGALALVDRVRAARAPAPGAEGSRG